MTRWPSPGLPWMVWLENEDMAKIAIRSVLCAMLVVAAVPLVCADETQGAVASTSDGVVRLTSGLVVKYLAAHPQPKGGAVRVEYNGKALVTSDSFGVYQLWSCGWADNGFEDMLPVEESKDAKGDKVITLKWKKAGVIEAVKRVRFPAAGQVVIEYDCAIAPGVSKKLAQNGLRIPGTTLHGCAFRARGAGDEVKQGTVALEAIGIKGGIQQFEFQLPEGKLTIARDDSGYDLRALQVKKVGHRVKGDYLFYHDMHFDPAKGHQWRARLTITFEPSK